MNTLQKRLTFTQGMTIVTLKRRWYTNRQIIQALLEDFGRKVNLSTIKRTWQRFRETGSVAERKGRSRRKLCDARDERVLHRVALRYRMLSLRSLAGELSEHMGARISAETVRRNLLRYGLRRRLVARKLFLTKCQTRKREDWAHRHVNWPGRNGQELYFQTKNISRFIQPSRLVCNTE